MKSTKIDPGAGTVIGDIDEGVLVAKTCPGCREREAGPYCVEVDPSIMWPVKGSALDPRRGQMMIKENFHVPVWLCKPCFERLYFRACDMIHAMVQNAPDTAPATKKES